MDARYRQAYERARAAKLAELRSSPSFGRNRVLCGALPGVAAAVLVAVLARQPLAAAVALPAGGLAGLAAHALWMRHRARDAGSRARVSLWAGDRGYEYEPRIEPRGTVAFLRNREDARAEDCFSGAMAGGRGLLYNFTYITWETRTVANSNGGSSTQRERVTHRHTVLEVERPLPLARLSVERRATGLFRGLSDGMRSAFTDRRTVTLESEEFDRRFRVEVPDGCDDVAVRRLFEPSVVVGFIDGRLPIQSFQYERGTFVVWRDGHFSLDDLDPLDELVASASPVIELLGRAGERAVAASG